MAKRKSTKKKTSGSKAGTGAAPDHAELPSEKPVALEPGFEAAAVSERPEVSTVPFVSSTPPDASAGERGAGSAEASHTVRAGDAGEVARAFARLHVWQIQAVRDVLFVAGVIALVWLGYALRAVTVPLLVALLLAYLFEPVISRLVQHPKITRPMAVGGLLAVVGSIVVLILALITPFVVGQTIKLIREIQSGAMRANIAQLETHVPGRLKDSFEGFLELLPERPPSAAESEQLPAEELASAEEGESVELPAPLLPTDERIRQIVNDELRQNLPVTARDDAEELQRLQRTVGAVWGILAAVVGIGLLAFLIPFYFFFFSLWYHDVLRFGKQLIPEKNRSRVLVLLKKMDAVVSGFVRGRIVISLIMGALLAIGWLIFDVPYALPLGIVTGIFCAVPYLGVLGVPMAVGLLFFRELGDPDNSGLWWLWVFLAPTLVFVVVQLIEGYVLIPLIAGKATGLDPVTIVVAVLAGGSVLGIYGMLLAIPLAACGRILFTELFLPRIRAWTRGELSDPLPIERD